MSKIFTCGIDLGTTNSCISLFRDNKETIITDKDGSRVIPSVVQFRDKDTVIVGYEAKEKQLRYVNRTIYDSKRLIGHMYNEKAIMEDITHWSFKVIDFNGYPRISISYDNGSSIVLTAEDISSYILKHLSNAAALKEKLKEETRYAVIAVPAYFNDHQRKATMRAAEKAKLNVLRLVNEPTAAAIAYGNYHMDNKVKKNLLVYDFGGGTFDVSIVKIEKNSISVRATGGDSHLGGNDINLNLMNYYINKIRMADENVELDDKRIFKLRKACDDAKCQLSEVTETEIEFDLLNDLEIDTLISRSEFNRLNDALFKRTIEIVIKTLKEFNISKDEIDEIVLIGGSSRIPKVQELLKAEFPSKKINKDINPDEAVAIGASILADDLTINLIEKNESGKKILMPTNSTEIFDQGDKKTSVKEIQMKLKYNNNINNDYKIEDDAAYKKPVVNKHQRLKIEDMLTQSLGTETSHDEFSVILKKGTRIPCSKKELFQTSVSNQKAIKFRTLEGDDKKASKNTLLFETIIDNIPPAKKGVIKFTETMTINENGVVQISIKENSGRVKEARINIRY